MDCFSLLFHNPSGNVLYLMCVYLLLKIIIVMQSLIFFFFFPGEWVDSK